MLTTNNERNPGFESGIGRGFFSRLATAVASGTLLSGAALAQQMDLSIESFQLIRTGPETVEIQLEYAVAASGGAFAPEFALTIYDAADVPVYEAYVTGTQNPTQCQLNGCNHCTVMSGGVSVSGICGRTIDGFLNCPCFAPFTDGSFQDPNKLIHIEGDETLRAVIDSGNAVVEVNELNNSFTAVVPGWCAGDLNGDQQVDLSDLAMELSVYGSPNPPAGTDLDGDGMVALSDLAAVLSRYGLGCP